MHRLTLAGRTPDKALLLVDDHGVEYTLELDARLRAAVHLGSDTTTTPGTLETTMNDDLNSEPTLRPREIQTRIRAGETAEQVAQAARTSVERIRSYIDPVLAERAHVAERALGAGVRRPSGDSVSRQLGDAVAAHLGPLNVAMSSVSWDAWRRDDGRWSLTASFAAGQRSGLASFSFDMRGNYVVADNDDARWLVGDAPAAADAVPDDLQRARERRQAIDDILMPPSLGDDAIELVTAAAAGVSAPSVDVEAPTADLPLVETTATIPAPIPGASQSGTPAQGERRHRKNTRRAVPSWDEIMFGGNEAE